MYAIFLCVNMSVCVFVLCVDVISFCVCVDAIFLCVNEYISVCFCLSLLDAIGIACFNHLRPQPPQSAIKNKECIKVSGVEQASPWVIGIHLCSCTLILVCGVVQIQFWDVVTVIQVSLLLAVFFLYF